MYQCCLEPAFSLQEEGAYKEEMCEDKEEPSGDGLEWEVVVFRISKICTCNMHMCINMYMHIRVCTCVYNHIYFLVLSTERVISKHGTQVSAYNKIAH